MDTSYNGVAKLLERSPKTGCRYNEADNQVASYRATRMSSWYSEQNPQPRCHSNKGAQRLSSALPTVTSRTQTIRPNKKQTSSLSDRKEMVDSYELTRRSARRGHPCQGHAVLDAAGRAQIRSRIARSPGLRGEKSRLLPVLRYV